MCFRKWGLRTDLTMANVSNFLTSYWTELNSFYSFVYDFLTILQFYNIFFRIYFAILCSIRKKKKNNKVVIKNSIIFLIA